MENCCPKTKPKGFWLGIWLGILPHSFCLAFIIFTIIGSTVVTAFFRKLLLTPYFFQGLIGLSFILATISAVIYLKRFNNLSLVGIQKKKGYLNVLYGTTIGVNLLLFLVIFPLMVNTGRIKPKGNIAGETQKITLEVSLPCSGHAFLIGDELKKTGGITDFRFSLPNLFWIEYDSGQIGIEQIMNLPIFTNFKARVVENG